MDSIQKYYYDTELVRQLWCRINEQWTDKWAKDFGGTQLILDELESKDKFYNALKADIFSTIQAQKGEKIAKEYIIEKDTIENHLKNYRQQVVENNLPKPFLRDKSRNAYAYYLGYQDGYRAYTKLFEFENLRKQYQAIPVVEKSLTIVNQVYIPIIWQNSEGNTSLEIIATTDTQIQLNPPKATLLSVFCRLAMITFFAFMTLSDVPYKPNASFEIVNSKQKYVAPTTVVLKYQLDNEVTNEDSICWGNSIAANYLRLATEVLKEKQATLSYYYEFPNVYPIMLFRGKDTVCKKIVYVGTNDWLCFAKRPKLEQDSFLKPLRFEKRIDFVKKGVMHLPKPIGYPLSNINFYNFKDFGVEASSFTLETRLKNTLADGGEPEYDCTIWVYDEQGNKITANFLSQGAFYYSFVDVGNKRINAKNTGGFEEFGIDLSYFRTIKMTVKNNILSFNIDGKDFKQTFKCSGKIGKIKGLRFSFKGHGTMDFVKLYDGKQQLQYEDNFDDGFVALRKQL
jgi:hypothetical protein